MSLSVRIKRIEARHASVGNPLEKLTDEELEAAIAATGERITAATGMSLAELAYDLGERREPGALPDGLTPELVSGFVRSFKAAPARTEEHPV